MRIGILGCGNVGGTTAYALITQGTGSELVLVDRNEALADAQAKDLAHATPFAYPLRVRSGGVADLAGCGIVVLTAGTARKPGESRLDLLQRNAGLVAELAEGVAHAAPECVILVATNPVDVMTTVATHASGFPPGRVIGSGTILDTARFRTLLGTHVGVSPKSVHAYVLGEHGDTEVLAWSAAKIGGVPFAGFAEQCGCALTDALRDEIDARVRKAAPPIIAGKGATFYGIGTGLARICRAIADDERTVLTVSVLEREVEGVRDVALSLPRVVGAGGVVRSLAVDLDPTERAALRRSAEALSIAAMDLRK